MLASKTIIADIYSVPTLIFDEIDTGVSGKAAGKVGNKLSAISKSHQVLCITHLAQIASMSDNHYYINKMIDKERTFTNVSILDYEGKTNEIARLLSGEISSENTIRLAKEMLENTKK